MDLKRVGLVAAVLAAIIGGYALLRPQRPEVGPIARGTETCSVATLDWMEVTEQYDEKAVASLAANFEATAKADATKLKQLAEGSGAGKLGSSFSTPAEYSSTRVAKVSQEFFENAFAWRQAVCNLERLIADKRITDPTSLLKAQDQLIDLSVQFGKVKAKEEGRRVTPDKASISFGHSAMPQDLALRSTLANYADWSAEPPKLFDLGATTGAIKPDGSTAIRIQPIVNKLAVGRNVEDVWFNWQDENGVSGKFSVTLTATRQPKLEYNVTDVDDLLVLKLNGVEVTRTRNTSGWVQSPFDLIAGDNDVEVQVFNAATRRGQFGPREGWRYAVSLRVGASSMPLSGGEDAPPAEHWGATFTVERVLIALNAENGTASLSSR